MRELTLQHSQATSRIGRHNNFLHFSLFSARLEAVTKDSDGFLVRECEFNINLRELRNLN